MLNKHEGTVRRLIDDVWNAGKYDVVDQIVTPDFMHHDPMNPTRGPQAFGQVVKQYRTAFPDLKQTVDDLFSAGDKVVARLTCSGTQRGPFGGIAPTNRSGKVSAIVIARFNGDRIAETYVDWDALGLMQQLGVVTLPGKTRSASA